MKFFTQSGKNKEILKEKSGKVLISPANTRWIYLFYVIDRLLELKQSITSIPEEMPLLDVPDLSPANWQRAKRFCAFLKPFADAVTDLEGEFFSTTNRVIPALLELLEHIDEFQKQGDFLNCIDIVRKGILSRFAFVMDSSCSTFQPVYCTATFLDIRFRDCLEEPLVAAAKQEILRLIKREKSNETPDPATSEDIQSQTSSSTMSKYSKVMQKILEKSRQTIGRQKQSPELELEMYLTNGFEDVSPLDYWLKKAVTLPQLAKVAFQILPLPASSAPIERVFSLAGIACSGKRNRLGDSSLENEVMLKANRVFCSPLV